MKKRKKKGNFWEKYPQLISSNFMVLLQSLKNECKRLSLLF